MYFPPHFDKARAAELGKLVKSAYQKFADFKAKKPWTPPSGYMIVCEIFYRTVLSFDVNDPVETTAIDREMEEVAASEPVSFGIGDTINDLVYQDVPMGFVATKGKTAYIVFRGTVTPREWIFDANIRMQPYRVKGWGNVSNGFQNIYNRCRDSFMPSVKKISPDFEIFVTGHSLGGALSVLCLPDVANSTHFKQPSLYNFGGPRVGDAVFADKFDTLAAEKAFRVVNSSDVVTAIPLPVEIPALPSGFYAHVGTAVEFSHQANDIGINHTMDTYIAKLEA
jgi:triacylglycerol lipase